MLIAMRENGQLTDGRKPKVQQRTNLSHAAIVYTLTDLGLTGSQSSRYQKEGGVPPAAYEAWVARVMESDDGVLTAEGLRTLARRSGEPDGPDNAPVPFAAAARRIRRLVAKLRTRMSSESKARLRDLLRSLSHELETERNRGG